MKEAMSIGIIGGADGPTAVFVTGRFPWEIILLGVVCIALCVYIFRKKK
jgi:oxaloacetate decarboxylase beta subunit